MKVVINTCFGGFGLSDEGKDLYASKKGLTLYRYTQTEYKHSGGKDLYVRQVGANDLFSHTYTKDHGDSFSEYPGDDTYFSTYDISREDPLLIEVVQELGDKASSRLSKLRIVEIPDGTEYEISEYDGNEHIAEKHQTWS